MLQGCSSYNSSHFADGKLMLDVELERFQRDFASHHKNEREAGYQKKMEVNVRKQEDRTNFLQTYNDKNKEMEKKK